jgi:hypothetical protein
MKIMSSLLNNVNLLIAKRVGDVTRLEHIKETIENNKKLYDSDLTYLDQLIKKHLFTNEQSKDESHSKIQETQNMTDKNESSNEVKKHCSSCDSIVENYAEFCSSCGKVLEDTLKQESKRMEHTNEVKKTDRKVLGIGLAVVGVFIIIIGFSILQGALNMPQIFAGQYILLALFVLVIGVMTMYAGKRVARKKKGQFLCIYCRYIAETDRELHNHELQCDRKLKHDKLNK